MTYQQKTHQRALPIAQKIKLTWHTWIIILTTVALIVRLFGLGELSYWFDEAREVVRALTPWPDVLFVTDGADPPLYRLLLFTIVQQTTAEFWLRLPSVLFSVASVYLAYRWLAALKLERIGVATAFFLAFLPVQIHYAQEVSQYSLVVFLSLLLLWSSARLTENSKPSDWALFTVATIVSLYTYYGLAWLMPVLVLNLAWRLWNMPENKSHFIRFFSYLLIVFVSLVILYVTMIQIHLNRFTTNKQLTSIFVEPGLWASLQALDNQFFELVKFFVTPYTHSIPNWFIWLFVFLTLIGIVLLGFRGQNGRRILVSFGGTILTAYVVYGLGYYPFDGRYLLILLPFFAAFLGAVVASLATRRWLGWPTAAILLLLFIPFWRNMPDTINRWDAWIGEEMRPATAYLNDQATPDDHVFVYYGAGSAYRVYQKDATYPTTFGTWFRHSETAEKVAEIEEAVAQSSHFWLIMTHIHADEDAELIAALAEKYHLEDTYTSPGTVLVRFGSD